jgi:DNA repair ATPase RecN
VLRAGEGGTSMQAQLTKLDAAENDLKRLMAEVTRVMEKVQEAVERISCKTAATSDTHRGPADVLETKSGR